MDLVRKLLLLLVMVALSIPPATAGAEDATSGDDEETYPLLCTGDEEALCWRVLVSVNRTFGLTVESAKSKWAKIGEKDREKFNKAWLSDMRWALGQGFPAHPAMPEDGWTRATEEAIQAFLGEGDRVELLRAYLRPAPRRSEAPGLMISLPPPPAGVTKGSRPCDTSGRHCKATARGSTGLRLIQAI